MQRDVNEVPRSAERRISLEGATRVLPSDTYPASIGI